MKIILPRILILILLISNAWLLTSCTASTDPAAMNTVTEFYRNYLKEMVQFPPNGTETAALIEEYCTQEFQDRLKRVRLSADPFLDVQDFEENWPNEFKVEEIEGKENMFRVCVPLSFDQSNHCVQVEVVEVDGKWKINNVMPE